MDLREFKKYLWRFEEEIVVSGISADLLTNHMLIPVRPNKLSRTQFARIVGHVLPFRDPFVIDYYGHLKKTRGFLDYTNEKREELSGRQLRMIEGTVFYFQKVRIKDIFSFTKDDYIHSNFLVFKEMLREMRWGKRET